MRPGQENAIRGLALESALAEVIAAMGRDGVEPLLIKGPAIVRWLYDSPAERSFEDLDLLVAPADRAAAAGALAAAGFARLPANACEASLHAAAWVRGGPLPVAVDLHSSLRFLVDRDPEAVWRTLRTGADRVEIAGVPVWVPGVPAHALIVALHAAQHGFASPKPLEDLRRSLLRVGGDDWREAAGLARSISAEAPFAAGLRMLAAGAELADRLGLTDRPSARLGVYLSNGPVCVLAAGDLLAAAGSARERARLLLRILFPSSEYLRRAQPLARRGRLGRALARVLRPARLLIRALAGYPAWRAVAREERPRDRVPGRWVDAARRAWWALRALRACRHQLKAGQAGLASVRLPSPPACRTGGERGLGRVLRAGRASCLERSLIRQRWYRSRGDERELVVGVTAPGEGFAAHAWLAGDRVDPDAFSELLRRPADRR